jgi:STE24 endopeptidase
VSRTQRWLVVGALLAPLWALAAWRIGQDVVPGDLRLPGVDARKVFGGSLIDDAARYERFFYVAWVVEQIVRVTVLWLYARKGVRFLRDSAAGPIGTGVLLGMLGLGLTWLSGLPFSVARLWWERRHGVSEMGYPEAVVGNWIALGATFVWISFALLVVMFLARTIGDFWWIPGAAVFTGLVALFLLVSPYFATETRSLDDPKLEAAAQRYERQQGVGEDIPILVEEVSADTTDANAYATGFGPTRKIFLWDTLLDGRFTIEEEQAVVAHEIAHHSSDHLLEGVAWFGLFALPSSYLLLLVTRRRGGMGAPEAVPLALFVTVVFYLALTPVQNLISRRAEAEADWKTLESTRDPAALRGVMVGFAETSLANPDPPGWASWLFDTHPPLARRIAMAEAWQARQP